MIQVGLVLVPDYNLQVAICYLFVGSHDDGDHKVKHYDLQEVGLSKENKPDQVDIDVDKDAWLFGEAISILF